MKLLHEKSQCCAAKIIRFGGKRRQCLVCQRTWRVHRAKRGRKAARSRPAYLRQVFGRGLAVKQMASRSQMSAPAVYKRFNHNLTGFVARRRIIRLRGQKLILVIDALWQYFQGRLWTLYCLAVKAPATDQVTVWDPVLRPGRENAADWEQLINDLPLGTKNRIIALVSDGIRGIEAIAAGNRWIIQRCHFHLLSMLQKMRGKRASTPGRLIREEIYGSVKLALSETSSSRLNVLCQRLAVLAQNPLCPARMRMAVRDFLRRLPEFRSYLEYPELNLPTTVNVMESVNSLIRRRARTVNSPQAWHKWAVATIRFKSKFTCK